MRLLGERAVHRVQRHDGMSSDRVRSCGLCGRALPPGEVGWALDTYLCHPDEGQDCYRLVTVYDEPLPDGRRYGQESVDV